MLTRFKGSWTSLIVIAALLFSLVAPYQALAAASRITITSLYTQTGTNTGLPVDDSAVPRYTTSPISVTATIENITDDQVPNIYYEVTNVTTGVTTTETADKAQHQAGSSDITFTGVKLTEGLNKVIIKLGSTSSIASAPGWAYYTATTSITGITANGQPFDQSQIYPANPSQSTMVNLSVTAPNAQEVDAYVNGSSSPTTGYSNNDGSYLFVGDDANNSSSTANIRFNPGDNPITFLAKNSNKTYQIQKNLIYDNGKPFAFQSTIAEQSGGSSKALVDNPTVTSNDVTVKSLLKVDTDSAGAPLYPFVTVNISGKQFGPYNLLGATPAVTASGIYPTKVYTGYSDTLLAVNGTELDTQAGTGVTVKVEETDGTVVDTLSTPYKLAADKTTEYFTLPAGDVKTSSGETYHNYNIVVMNDSSVLGSFPLQAVAPTTPLTAVDAAATQSNLDGLNLSQGYNPSSVQPEVVFGSGVTPTPSELSVSFVYPDGRSASGIIPGTSLDAANHAVTYSMPQLAAGDYLAKIAYQGNEVTERYLHISPAAPAAPTAETPSQPINLLSKINASDNATYLVVKGANLGVDLSAIQNAALVGSGGSPTIPLTPFDVDGQAVTFLLPSQSMQAAGLTDGTYDLKFQVAPAGQSATSLTVPGYAKADSTLDSNGAYVTGVSPNQYFVDDLKTTPPPNIQVTGVNLNQLTGMSVKVVSEDGVTNVNGSITVDSATAAHINVPNTLSAGNYLLQIYGVYNSSNLLLTQYPLVITNPMMTSISPNSKASTDTSTTTATIYGTNLGRQSSKLKLRFTSDTDQSMPSVDTQATSVSGGQQATFTLPSLPEGTYTATLLYNDTATASAVKFTVTSPPATLAEDAAWSAKGKDASGNYRFKVYDFSANLTIPTDRNQFIRFHFYKSTTDTLPDTLFHFTYSDPNMPYVNSVYHQVSAGDTQGLKMDPSNTEISELPTGFYIHANSNAQKVNVYLDHYDSNTAPVASLTSHVSSGGENIFTYNLSSLSNGQHDLIFVPSSNASTDTSNLGSAVVKSGENVAGKQDYTVNVNSAPYIIFNNVYDGQIIKDPQSDLNCTIGSTPHGGCISGRLVNVQPSDYGNVVLYLNGEPVNSITPGGAAGHLDPSEYTGDVFNILIANHSMQFGEGKNTLKFEIYQTINGVPTLVTQTSINIFVFSTNAPDITNVQPVDTSSPPKFTAVGPASQYTYTTHEKNVQFTGQFANADEIKLTVHYTDANGKPYTVYDRRYNNFNLQEPANTNLFQSVNNPAGQFTTTSIPLNATGDTIFEFTVNDSTVNTPKTITVTITREPEPYQIVYPTLVNNGTNDVAYLNSNFVQIEMIAENADSVVFGRTPATPKTVTLPDGSTEVHYFYDATNLKKGNNPLKFTITRGTTKTNGTIILYNANTPVVGAEYKTPLTTRINAFNNEVQMTFPAGTTLKRNDSSAANQFLTGDRQILLGLADPKDGRVDKWLHPASYDGQQNNPNPLISPAGQYLLAEPTGRFRAAGPLVWTDAGVIKQNPNDLAQAYSGSGQLPYDSPQFYTRNLNDEVVPSNRGTLTLQYDPSIRQDDWKYLTVYHYDIFEDSTGTVKPQWRNLGGTVNTKNHTITVPFDTFGYYQVMYMDQSFDDVISHPWARDDLDVLYSKGYMLPKDPPSSFVPNDPITRGEFATMLVKVFDLPLHYSDTPTFSDVLRYNPLNNGLYDYKYIETAAYDGIVRGSGGGRFMPDSAITRQDAAVMIAKAANLSLNQNTTQVAAALQKAFTDASSIDTYAQAAVSADVKAGLMSGTQNVLIQGQTRPTFRFDPLNDMTRADASAVAINILVMLKKIP